MKHIFNVNGTEVDLTFRRIKDSRQVQTRTIFKPNWFKVESAVTCWVETSNQSLLESSQGVALCSRKDKFDWKRGRRESLTNALAGINWHKVDRAELWRQVLALSEKEWRR
jgi:hypothetical protein